MASSGRVDGTFSQRRTSIVPGSAVCQRPVCMSAKNCSGLTPYGWKAFWKSARSSSEKYTCFRSCMKKSGVIPSKQPTEMPNAPADSLTIRVVRIAACAADSAGASSPARTHHPSMASPNEMPATSLIRLPSPAAASVEKPRRTPSVASMRSPATIMMALSAKPKPTMGTPTPTASLISWCLLGGSAAAASSAASAASVDLGRANAGRRLLRRPGAHADHARRCAASRLRAEPNMDNMYAAEKLGTRALRQWVVSWILQHLLDLT